MRVLKFTAVWCSSCHKIKGKLQPGIEEIDIESDEGEELALKYGITSLPTIIVIDDDGSIIDQSTGTKDILSKYGT
jgi:thiol-disulfide isomerase/thioredoxin